MIDSIWLEAQLLSSEDYLPTPAQCGVHLELLECFHALKQKVMSIETMDHALGFSLHPDNISGAAEELQRHIKNESHREMKWHAFLELAVQRFEVWWRTESALGPDNQRFGSRVGTLEINKELDSPNIYIHELMADRLPPLGETKTDLSFNFFYASRTLRCIRCAHGTACIHA